MADENWRSSNKTIKDKIKYLFKNSVNSDVTLCVNDGNKKKEYQVHQFILGLSSEVFEAALTGHFLESTTKYIEINDVEHNVFDAFVKYLYTDEIHFISLDHSMKLYQIAHVYMVTNLIGICLSHVRSNLREPVACVIFDFANLYSIEDLKAKCLSLLQTGTHAVVGHDNFLNASIQSVNTILSQDKLCISELELFKGIEKWIKNQDEAITDELCQEFLPQIRYKSMTPKEFADGPVKSGLLKSDQWSVILANLVSGECSLSYPKGFNRSLRTKLPKLRPMLLGDLTGQPKRTETNFYAVHCNHLTHQPWCMNCNPSAYYCYQRPQ